MSAPLAVVGDPKTLEQALERIYELERQLTATAIALARMPEPAYEQYAQQIKSDCPF